MKKQITLFFLVVLFAVAGKNGWAQSAIDLKLNEVLVLNDSLNVDDYGQHSSWIEIFNSGYNSVNIGGCYLTDDLNNPTKYWIPIGDPMTLIPPRCFLLFWADGKPSRGISHLNFDLNDAKTIALFDASGKSVIDQLSIAVPQVSNHSFGRINETSNEWAILDKITPGSTNDHTRKISAGDKFVEMDPTGIGMTVIAMMVVFTSLALLYAIFSVTGGIFKRLAAKQVSVKPEAGVSVVKQEQFSGEVSAAIAMALHLYQSELHDEENTVLTIKRVARSYSPWSSKIYTLRKYPR